MSGTINRNSTVYWFFRSISCSETTFTILNKAAGIGEQTIEQAAHTLAGGLWRHGHACGMTWGAALAAGLRARQKFSDESVAQGAALEASIKIMHAFGQNYNTVDCKTLIGCDLNRLTGRLAYIFSTEPLGCAKRMVDWTVQADDLINNSLAEYQHTCTWTNCAVQTMNKCCGSLGLDKNNAALVSGFAGGLGLSGNACAALAVGIFALGLKYYTEKTGPRDGFLTTTAQEIGLSPEFTQGPSRLIDAFIGKYGTCLCSDITGQVFSDKQDLAKYLDAGGCTELIDAIVDCVETC